MGKRDRKFVRRGDFLVPKDDLEEAKDSFNERSKRSRSVDKALRGPIESDVDVWKRNQRTMDYPGVDTPNESPQQAAEDFFLPEERMGRGREVIADPQERGSFLDESLNMLREGFRLD